MLWISSTFLCFFFFRNQLWEWDLQRYSIEWMQKYNIFMKYQFSIRGTHVFVPATQYTIVLIMDMFKMVIWNIIILIGGIQCTFFSYTVLSRCIHRKDKNLSKSFYYRRRIYRESTVFVETYYWQQQTRNSEPNQNNRNIY